MKKKGFTLIELLAVIVILAVIALIATPAVLGIIEDSKKSAAESSARSIVSAAKTHYMQNIMDNKENANVDLSTDTLKYDGEQAKKGVLNYDKSGNVTGKMYISGYCVEVKNDGSIISEKIDENDCSIDLPAPSATDLSCFEISGTMITGYKCYEGNTYGLPTITDIILPDSITDIRMGAFSAMNLTSVVIPGNVTYIGTNAFRSNKLTSVTISNGVKGIADGVFANNQLTSITIPNSVTNMDANIFGGNANLKTITIDNSEGVIIGSPAPWGATNATVTYLR